MKLLMVGADGKATNDSAFFMGSNRGKRSITVDIALPEGARNWCANWRRNGMCS